MPDEKIDALLGQVRTLRVGGSYWAAEPPLPASPYTLVRVRHAKQREAALDALGSGETALCCLEARATPVGDHRAGYVYGECDPWHLLAGASRVIVDADDELALLASIAGMPVDCVGAGPYAPLASGSKSQLRQVFRDQVIEPVAYFDPYSGKPIGFADALAYCGFWRELVDSNREISAAVGFAFWKRPTVAPLLWRGSDVRFLADADAVRDGEQVAIWKARTSPAVIAALEQRGARLIEVEDGFIRSAGLGADCVPPLSIVVDRLGAHFDPARPSELEQLLETGVFGGDVLDRARRLRDLIVASGLSKYAAGRQPLDRRAADRRHILVPGQVEDDRAVASGGQGLASNLELLRRVRADAPDAYILYKPHPDIEAGHRAGAIADELCLTVADEIVRDDPISALIELVDEVQVNTSLAGFEALLRDKPVTTHGVPFYAGWGLTRDLGKVPSRRTTRRTLDELIAAVLLLYPRYLDPVTRLPCSAEILVRRLSESGRPAPAGIVVQLRRLQGRLKRHLAAIRIPGVGQ